MKFGFRKPSLKKTISANTTGRVKKEIKKAIIPGYGQKGMGWVKNPKRAAYNKIYNKTTTGCLLPIILFFIVVSFIFAHNGKQDSRGGHRDNKNKSGLGSYHYHHGYQAHLHDKDGKCPYKNK